MNTSALSLMELSKYDCELFQPMARQIHDSLHSSKKKLGSNGKSKADLQAPESSSRKNYNSFVLICSFAHFYLNSLNLHTSKPMLVYFDDFS
jgi:hypothetical protein